VNQSRRTPASLQPPIDTDDSSYHLRLTVRPVQRLDTERRTPHATSRRTSNRSGSHGSDSSRSTDPCPTTRHRGVRRRREVTWRRSRRARYVRSGSPQGCP
jgi:hypothetical protein